MTVEKLLKAYGETHRERPADEEKLRVTVEASKEAFRKGEAEGEISWLEFLYQQAAYIRKRWWAAQGCVLGALWIALFFSHSGIYARRCMGILTPCFVILLLPEFWKNRSSNAMEVESAAYFPLRKIYAARLILFGMADMCFLSVFGIVSAFTIRMTVMDFLIQFILPFNVTCCICFLTLQSRRNFGIDSSLTLCMGWVMVWVFAVLNESIYARISLPVWIAAIAGSSVCFCYSILRMWSCGAGYYETAPASELL